MACGRLACAADAETPKPHTLEAVAHQHRMIYHSPQTPGFTSWAQIWCMRDGTPVVTFTQATGPVQGRKPASADILNRMPEAQRTRPGYDMTGLKLENVYLHSVDGGKTWKKIGSEPFTSCMNGMFGSALQLPDGAILRCVWGHGLSGQDSTYFDVLPAGFLQRSTDRMKSWSKPDYFSQDPNLQKLQTYPKRLRRLRDGRILMTGGACPYEPNQWKWDEQGPKMRPCLWVSKDPTGASWHGPLYVAPSSTEEWDAAELDNGDLLGVFRTIDTRRRQAILVQDGESWKPGAFQKTPFPNSGQPELLATREGPVLHIADNGVWATSDRGAMWTKLSVPGSAYYPSAVQLKNGAILVVSHVGNDDPYGKDQSIVLDVFRLKTK
jgi:hypothetical protein